jgi:hypothetical protein
MVKPKTPKNGEHARVLLRLGRKKTKKVGRKAPVTRSEYSRNPLMFAFLGDFKDSRLAVPRIFRQHAKVR